MVQRIVIRRATMKGDASQGNPMGFFQGKFKINGITKVFTTDYEVLTEDEYKKAQEKYGKQILFKKFRHIGDFLEIPYDDTYPTPLDKQKRNFCAELIKMPEMRNIDDEPNSSAHWIVSYGNEVSVRKASRLMKQIKLLNIGMSMDYISRKNLVFYLEPSLRPDTKNNSDLFIMLCDIRPDDKGNPLGIMISSEKRMDAVLESYYADTEESQFRTTINKAIEWEIIKLLPTGYHVNDQFIGGNKELVYVWLKNNPAIYDNHVMLKVAQRDVLTAEDDMERVQATKFELQNNVDWDEKSIEDLRAIAKELGMKNTANMHKPNIVQRIKDRIEENKLNNKITKPGNQLLDLTV